MLHHDRPLLFGLVALEQELVGAADLVDAFRQWRQDPERSLAQILASQGRLSRDGVQAIERLLSDSSLGEQAAAARRTLDSPTTTWRPETTSIGIDIKRLRASATVDPPLMDATVRFQPLRLHASGGLGQVFEAEDAELKRRVALKEIRPQYADDEESRRRFVFEAEVTGNLEHPGIVPVYGLGAHPDGRPFYAMRFIEGETLSESIQTFHAVSRPDFASREFRQLLGRLVAACNAVAFAHSRGIVHRDLKPQNVMLGPFGETLVVDWGLAKPLAGAHSGDSDAAGAPFPLGPQRDESLDTATGEFVGTPAFMSPEQARGDARGVGPASDVFSLGAMLYVLLAGQLPRRGSALELVHFAADWHAPSACTDQPRAPRALAAVAAKAMALEPANRYASPLDLTAEIERWLADEPVAAYPDPWIDRAFRWVRKHRLPVAVASALVLVATVALGIGYILVSQERDIAQTERTRARVNAAATREVVEQFLIQIGDDRWSQIPGFEDVRLEMVNLAANRYRGLITQQPSDAELMADAAMAFRRCANLYRMIGEFERAAESYSEAVAGFQRATATDPNSGRNVLLMGEVLGDRAQLIFRQKGALAAEFPLREALAVSRRLRASRADSVSARQAEARIQVDLAEALCDLERFDEAVEMAREAAAVLQGAADANSQPVVNRLTAAYSGLTLGQILRQAGQWDEASVALESAWQRASEYSRNYPRDVNLQFCLAAVNLERSVVAAHQNGPTDTVLAAFDESITALNDLARQFPDTGSFRRKLAEALTLQSELQLRGGDPGEADRAVQRAVELLTQLDQKYGSPAVFQPLLASAHLAAGKVALVGDHLAAARIQFLQAQECSARACATNPASRRLGEQSRQIQSLLESIE